MKSVNQVQSVAKRLEKMLETALSQLKIEQTMRKKSENKILDLELEIANKDYVINTIEDKTVNIVSEKDEKISNLESTINFLQSVVIQKEKEILGMQEMLEKSDKNENYENLTLDKTVEKYEETLSQFIGNISTKEAIENKNEISMEDISFIEDDYNDTEEEYILDESLEELNESVFIFEESRPGKIKRLKAKKHKTRCPICQAVFPNKLALQEHQKETGHIKKYQCDDCDKNFKTKSIVQVHKQRIHSTAMPFKCMKCDKRFKDQGSCKRHETNDSVHIRLESVKRNLSLSCNICGKEFDRLRRWCLDQHLLTHLSSKKFSCDNCGKFYRQKSYWQTHMKGCIDIKDIKCD